jgi:hypothetical protein
MKPRMKKERAAKTPPARWQIASRCKGHRLVIARDNAQGVELNIKMMNNS